MYIYIYTDCEPRATVYFSVDNEIDGALLPRSRNVFLFRGGLILFSSAAIAFTSSTLYMRCLPPSFVVPCCFQQTGVCPNTTLHLCKQKPSLIWAVAFCHLWDALTICTCQHSGSLPPNLMCFPCGKPAFFAKEEDPH